MDRGLGWARGLGFLAGIAIASLAVLGWRLPPGSGTLGADLVVATAPTGELAVSTTGPIITASGMRPGPADGAPSAQVELSNRTAALLDVTVVARASTHELDDLLWVQLEGDGEGLFRGPLSELLRGAPPFRLASGERTTLEVRTWLPGSVSAGYQGRVVTVDLSFGSSPVRFA
jgi:hypothetical protein